ncbi:tail-anchored protein insertion receptor WRB-like isoform X1 [Camponotus floridanus]|uniref:tail-anchored protein insertion receptor WRB-like isoform X1 n=1 Tax=Camponotus floridanus TaxID=104421 RepID=UPI000DC66CFA|nr:tail-anchored protein insertion receptor WRB-like isoform X1 [Camponotus floridanus]
MNLLVVTTLSSILDNIIPFFIKFIFPHVFAQRKYDIELRNELNDLKEKMTGLSIMNEFAKYAKLQRRCNQLENILKKNMDERLSWRLKLQMLLTYSFHILNGILILLLLYIYKKEPVIILSEGTLWPLQDVLSWPCQHENAISLLVWIMIVRLGVSACIKLRV